MQLARRCGAPTTGGVGLQMRLIRMRGGGRSKVSASPTDADPSTATAPFSVSSSNLGLLSSVKLVKPEGAATAHHEAASHDPRATVAELVRRELTEMRLIAQNNAPRAAAPGASPSKGKPAQAPTTRPTYAISELQRALRRREDVKSHMAKTDITDVIRGDGRAEEFLQRIPALNPSTQFQQREIVTRVAQVRASGGATAVAELVSQLSDRELVMAVKVGALDASDLMENDEATLDEGLATEQDTLPNEYFADAAHLTEVAREVATTALSPSLPNDDEAAVLELYRREGPDAFTEEDIKLLSAFETRAATDYTVSSNALLRYVARKDDGIRTTLDALDRGKRAALADTSFQEALDYVQALEKREMDRRLDDTRPVMRRSAVDRAFFFDGVNSRPPPGAMANLPPPVDRSKPKNKEIAESKKRLRDQINTSSGSDLRPFTRKPL